MIGRRAGHRTEPAFAEFGDVHLVALEGCLAGQDDPLDGRWFANSLGIVILPTRDMRRSSTGYNDADTEEDHRSGRYINAADVISVINVVDLPAGRSRPPP